MQLEMFLAVVEERSVNKAAGRVCRTQPAVSIALRKLEEEFGVPLLNRTRLGPPSGIGVDMLGTEQAARRNNCACKLRAPITCDEKNGESRIVNTFNT